jgi:hypothetical protein
MVIKVFFKPFSDTRNFNSRLVKLGLYIDVYEGFLEIVGVMGRPVDFTNIYILIKTFSQIIGRVEVYNA